MKGVRAGSGTLYMTAVTTIVTTLNDRDDTVAGGGALVAAPSSVGGMGPSGSLFPAGLGAPR
jgi:hypothetical protein